MSKSSLILKEYFRKFIIFYKALYSSEVSFEDRDTVKDFIAPLNLPTLTDDSISALNKPLTKNELWTTLKNMGTNESPRLDGLPCELYLTLLNDIIDLFLHSYNYYFQEGILSQCHKSGIITPLPKKR